MQTYIVVKGRLTGPRTIELDEAVSQAIVEVEVLIRPAVPPSGEPRETISAFFRHLPPGTRSKKEIDQQIQEERDSWGDR